MKRPLLALIALVLAGCATSPAPILFWNIPEDEAAGGGPVGLINGQPYQVKTITTVSEAPHAKYVRAKGEGRILDEEDHGDYVYYAIQERRSIHFDNASAIVDVISRYKSKRP
ncbi:MAG: hypothetical protein HN380_28640 [Victivallales bacterium]|jgi:hypothetical protein|nr:hypothetical protein [Victivallales bacterium]